VSQPQREHCYVTASEVGNFTYCPEAWYLQRFGRRPDRNAIQRLRAGTHAHQRIGKSTGQLFAMENLRRALVLVLIVLVALLLLDGLGPVILPALR
jgi:hypothetical protein